jgi:hypothetical protein
LEKKWQSTKIIDDLVKIKLKSPFIVNVFSNSAITATIIIPYIQNGAGGSGGTIHSNLK